MNAWRLTYRLLEPMFHASRELGTLYLTEPVISSYAQPYALGLVRSRYRLPSKETNTPTYKEDLCPLNEAGLYITPAAPDGPVSFRLERFNALGESYWYKMAQGVVAHELKDRFGGKPGARNRPQQGQLRVVLPNTRFTSYLLAEELPKLPPYCRLGKWMSKAQLTITSLGSLSSKEGSFAYSGELNPADIPEECVCESFDLLNVRPVPLLRNARYSGAYWECRAEGGAVQLPQDLQYRFP